MAKAFEKLTENISAERRASIEKRKAELRSEMYALNELRKTLNLTQEEVAEILNMEQGAVSRLERQEDMYVSTLQRFVEALGGRLRLVATFPGGEREIVVGRAR